jgi:hypothetical protein
MRIEGRSEKRAVAAISVYLMAEDQHIFTELATTINMSSQGARVISKHYRHPGERVRIVTTSGEFHRPARVIYSMPHKDLGYCIGLQFCEGDIGEKGEAWRPRTVDVDRETI